MLDSPKPFTPYAVPGFRWPAYPSHDVVICFNCSALLDLPEPVVSEFAEGNGAWKKSCRTCGMKTFYDVRGS